MAANSMASAAAAAGPAVPGDAPPPRQFSAGVLGAARAVNRWHAARMGLPPAAAPANDGGRPGGPSVRKRTDVAAAAH
jgi:hypothetical protein